MGTELVRDWMWSQSCDVVARAERLTRVFFRPHGSERPANWEPPADVLETAEEILIYVALPGVRAESVKVTADAGILAFSGNRTPPAQLQSAIIHRLELPHGRFERQLELPTRHHGEANHRVVDGCLLITLRKKDVLRE